jgi:hypothetical protein
MSVLTTVCFIVLCGAIVIDWKLIIAPTVKSIGEASHVLTEAPIMFLCPLTSVVVLGGVFVFWEVASLSVLTLDERRFHNDTG